jgi:hypothetical protein
MDDDVKGCKDDDDDDDGAMVGTPRDDYDMDAKVRQQHHLQHRIRRYFHRRPSRCRPRTSFVTIRIICDDLRIARVRERKRRQRAVRVFARAVAHHKDSHLVPLSVIFTSHLARSRRPRVVWCRPISFHLFPPTSI